MSGLRWYRRWRGGHWERWYVEMVGLIWLRRDHGTRPPGGHGTPECEDW